MRGELFETGRSTSHTPRPVFQTAGGRLTSWTAQYTRLYADFADVQASGGGEAAHTGNRWHFPKRKREWGQSDGAEGGKRLSSTEVGERIPDDSSVWVTGRTGVGVFVPETRHVLGPLVEADRSNDESPSTPRARHISGTCP